MSSAAEILSVKDSSNLRFLPSGIGVLLTLVGEESEEVSLRWELPVASSRETGWAEGGADETDVRILLGQNAWLPVAVMPSKISTSSTHLASDV